MVPHVKVWLGRGRPGLWVGPWGATRGVSKAGYWSVRSVSGSERLRTWGPSSKRAEKGNLRDIFWEARKDQELGAREPPSSRGDSKPGLRKAKAEPGEPDRTVDMRLAGTDWDCLVRLQAFFKGVSCISSSQSGCRELGQSHKPEIKGSCDNWSAWPSWACFIRSLDTPYLKSLSNIEFFLHFKYDHFHFHNTILLSCPVHASNRTTHFIKDMHLLKYHAELIYYYM